MIGAQLYTLREFTKTPADIAKTMARVKKMGYNGVQCSALGPIDLRCRIGSRGVRIELDGDGLVAFLSPQPTPIKRAVEEAIARSGRQQATSSRAARPVSLLSCVGELIIHGLGNAQVEQVDVKGGVGHTELDLTGDLGSSRTDARIKVGVGSVRLRVPRDANVEVEAQVTPSSRALPRSPVLMMVASPDLSD